MHQSVIDMVAARDDLDPVAARQRVADTLRLAAAAEREIQSRGGTVDAASSEHRRDHLLRAARARVWLTDDFEAHHRPEDIPNDDPLLVRARLDPQLVHPKLYRLCQLVARPTQAKTPEEMKAVTDEPAWRTIARARFEPAAQRIRTYVTPGRPEACEVMRRIVAFEDRTGEDDVTLKYEVGGFDLDACAKKSSDGTCEQKTFDQVWVSHVGAAQKSGFVPEFETIFGSHLVYVDAILDPIAPTDDDIRKATHRQWQATEFRPYMDALLELKAVKTAFVPGT